MAVAAAASLSPWSEHAEPLARWVAAVLLNRAEAYAVCPQPAGPDDFPDPQPADDALTSRVLVRHFGGSARHPRVALADRGNDDTGRFLAVTLRRSAEGDAAATPGVNFNLALHWSERLRKLGFDPLLEDADGAGGYRLLVLFDAPAPAAKIVAFAEQLTVDYADQGLTLPPRLAPAPDAAAAASWFRLPGPHPTLQHASLLWSFEHERWHDATESIAALQQARATPATFLRTTRPTRVALRTAPAPRHPEPAVMSTTPRPATPPAPVPAAVPHAAVASAATPPPPPAAAVALPPAAAQLVAAVAARTGMRDDEVVRRTFAWLAEQDDLLQALVLGQIPAVLRPAAAKALADKLGNP